MVDTKEKKITFLLGAGASFGHLAKGEKTPPMMNNFLSSSIKDGILTKEEFPELVQEIQKHAPSELLLSACQSVEKESNLEDFLGSVDETRVLELGRFYIHRYLGQFCNNSISNSSAYVKLANYIKNNLTRISGVINLNYDTVFDNALKNAHINIDYGLSNKKSMADLLYIKPHGSLNFRYFFGEYNEYPCCSWEQYIKKKETLFLQMLNTPMAM